MKFINFYSQNFEDVILERCFTDINDGYYIDVGAQHEEYDSVTKYFYEKGWSGINIEPLLEYCNSFNCRDRDVIIQCAAGSDNKIVKMKAFMDTGLSSLSPVNTELLEEAGLQFEEREIHVKTLNSILKSLKIEKKQFEFLKIDTEGYELEVIKGIDLFVYRPKIILCEVTKPNSKQFTEDYQEICDILDKQGYIKIYFDGLNQWWCEETVQTNMAKHFVLPPSVFDSTMITPSSSTTARKELEHERKERRELLEQFEHEKREKSELLQQLQNIYSSRKWKFAEFLSKLNIKSWKIKS